MAISDCEFRTIPEPVPMPHQETRLGPSDSLMNTFFAIVPHLSPSDCLTPEALRTRFGPDVDVETVLRGGLERAFVHGLYFNCLLTLVAERRDQDKPEAPCGHLSEAGNLEGRVPPDLRRRILDGGLNAIQLADLVRLITEPLWLAELWDAMDCLPPFWLNRSHQLRQDRLGRQGWFRRAAAARLEALRQAELPDEAEEAFDWLIQYLSPRLRLVLEAEAASRVDDIEDALEQTWAFLWRKRTQWQAGEAGLEDLRSQAVRRLRRRVRAGVPPPALKPRTAVESHARPVPSAPSVVTDQVPAGRIERLRESFPDLQPCDQELLRFMETDGQAACTSPEVCQELELSPEVAAERVNSLNLLLRNNLTSEKPV